jgi:hypothetical protein
MKTKHLILFAAAILLTVPAIVKAQITVGTHHGMTVSTISKIGDLYDNDQLTTSYTGGIYTLIPIKGRTSFQAELNYEKKGRSIEPGFAGNTQEFKSIYHYLQVPLLVRYSREFTINSHNKVYLNAGPYTSALLKSEYTLKTGDEMPASNVNDENKTPDAGILLGGGFSFPMNKFILEFDLRYEMGLVKMGNQPDNFRSKALNLTAGIRF